MITILKSTERYCNACNDREPIETFEIRISTHNSHTQILHFCNVCKSELEDKLKHPLPEDEQAALNEVQKLIDEYKELTSIKGYLFDKPSMRRICEILTRRNELAHYFVTVDIPRIPK